MLYLFIVRMHSKESYAALIPNIANVHACKLKRLLRLRIYVTVTRLLLRFSTTNQRMVRGYTLSNVRWVTVVLLLQCLLKLSSRMAQLLWGFTFHRTHKELDYNRVLQSLPCLPPTQVLTHHNQFATIVCFSLTKPPSSLATIVCFSQATIVCFSLTIPATSQATIACDG